MFFLERRVLGLLVSGAWLFLSCSADVRPVRLEDWPALPDAPPSLTLEVERVDGGIAVALSNGDRRSFLGNLCDHAWQNGGDGGLVMEARICNSALFTFEAGTRSVEPFPVPLLTPSQYRAVTVVYSSTSAFRVVSQPIELP
jgi:hypothetical protein